MGSLIASRLLFGLASLTLLATVLFWSLELLPGDFASAILGRDATPERLDEIRRELGLYRPARERFLDWLANALVGNLGKSWAFPRFEIMTLIAPRLENTLLLAALTAIVAAPVAIAAGVLSVIKHGSAYDRALSMATLIILSVLGVVIGYALMFLLVVKLQLLPFYTAFTDSLSFSDQLRAMALPVLTLSVVVFAPIMRMTRVSILNVMSAPYIEMAHLKGLTLWRVITLHALPNVVAPIVTSTMIVMANLIVGVVVVEKVFSYPGMGKLMITAVAFRDLPLMQTCSLIFGSLYILLNLSADVISLISNPRLRNLR